MGLEHEILNQFSRICCQHFKTEDLLINGSVSANAIPSKEKLTSFKVKIILHIICNLKIFKQFYIY